MTEENSWDRYPFQRHRHLFLRHTLKSFIFRSKSITNPLYIGGCVVRDVVIDVIDKAEI